MTDIEEQAVHVAEDRALVDSPESETRADITSPSTISMVTVRLSDAEPLPSIVEQEPHDDNGPPTGRTGRSVEENDVAQLPKSAADLDEAQTLGDNGVDRSRRTSMVSANSDEHGVEATSDVGPSSDRSRRGSSSTSSSEGSTRVDWEGLEKTEEQEPRDEGSDEVRFHGSGSSCKGQSC